jgi:uncharacterized protein (DUF2062 family)
MPENRRSRSLKTKNKENNLINRLIRSFRYWFIRLVRLQGHPIEIARGLAVGVFSGAFPWMGLQIIIAIFLAFCVRGNKIAAAAATWVSNPFTYIPLFLFNYKLGELFLGQGNQAINSSIFASNQSWAENWASLSGEFLLTLFFGSLITGIFASIITYFVSYRLLSQWHHRRQLRRKR